MYKNNRINSVRTSLGFLFMIRILQTNKCNNNNKKINREIKRNKKQINKQIKREQMKNKDSSHKQVQWHNNNNNNNEVKKNNNK